MGLEPRTYLNLVHWYSTWATITACDLQKLMNTFSSNIWAEKETMLSWVLQRDWYPPKTIRISRSIQIWLLVIVGVYLASTNDWLMMDFRKEKKFTEKFFLDMSKWKVLRHNKVTHDNENKRLRVCEWMRERERERERTPLRSNFES